MHSELKSSMRVLVLIALLVGLAACAKYPVVVDAPAPTAPAATPASTR